MEPNAKIELNDYKVPTYLIPEVDLKFHLNEDSTLVQCQMKIQKNPDSKEDNTLQLDGEELKLISIKLNNETLSPSSYTLSESHLTLQSLPDQAVLSIETEILPHKNKSFSGLYKTKTIYCTQMEAEGFRRVMFFPDRPDVLSIYTTTVIANKKQFPLLLSNGEKHSAQDLENGLHQVVWKDPFPKPCYLFALVAGDLDCVTDTYETQSKKTVELNIYVDKGKAHRAHHAMLCLKQSMKWDEDTYGLEYDLNIYNIVAVDDFNMGAMENKGLNIFNSKYVLADSQSATDDEFIGILRVIGHEYFHNWSGNRVTCRDWFQLSLKEGLTVYRDQEFTCDLTSRAVKRIEDVDLLRNRQFPEDSGPMAHPVRPPSYISIDNFYTMTVYHKGAEVIRMITTLLGEKLYKKGLALYFQRHDGQAVTTDDFVRCMEEVSGRSLKLFQNWYSQAGTPEVSAQCHYDESQQILKIQWQQESLNPVSKTKNDNFHIPISLGLLSSNGSSLTFSIESSSPLIGETLFELTASDQELTLYNVTEKPILSALRNFSAPVRFHVEYSQDDLYLMFLKDQDNFNRWEAGQKIYRQTLLQFYQDIKSQKTPNFPARLLHCIKNIVTSSIENPALSSVLLKIPSLHYISQFIEDVDPVGLVSARDFFRSSLSQSLASELLETYKATSAQKNSSGQEAVALRQLKNTILHLMLGQWNPELESLLSQQYNEASNMTDKLAALMQLSHHNSPSSQKASEHFYKHWKEDGLVMNKWLTCQALSRRSDNLTHVQQIMKDSAFDETNPNNIYSLPLTFTKENWFEFHSSYQESYPWFAQLILDVDSRNPQVASRMASAFNSWKKFAEPYRSAMRSSLESIHQNKTSKNVYEIIDKALLT